MIITCQSSFFAFPTFSGDESFPWLSFSKTSRVILFLSISLLINSSTSLQSYSTSFSSQIPVSEVHVTLKLLQKEVQAKFKPIFPARIKYVAEYIWKTSLPLSLQKKGLIGPGVFENPIENLSDCSYKKNLVRNLGISLPPHKLNMYKAYTNVIEFFKHFVPF